MFESAKKIAQFQIGPESVMLALILITLPSRTTCPWKSTEKANWTPEQRLRIVCLGGSFVMKTDRSLINLPIDFWDYIFNILWV